MKEIARNSLSMLIAIALVISVFFICPFAQTTVENPAEHRYTTEENTLVCYDGPDTMQKASEIYKSKATAFEKSNLPLAEYDKISFMANGEAVFVYAAGVAIEHGWFDQVEYCLPQRYTPVVIFDFEGSVNIVIDVSEMAELCFDGASTIASFATATVSPISRGVEATVMDKTVSFTITEPGDYTVVLGDDEKTAIHIFANSIESFDFGDNPLMVSPDDSGLPSDINNATSVVFMPGEYFWDGTQLYAQSNQTIFLCGGAVLHSNVRFGKGVTNAKIAGRGILDDSESLSWKIDNGIPRFVPINCDNSSNIDISGISILNPCLWAVQLYECDNIFIDNLHIITGKHNGDGISVQSSTEVKVTNSFIRGWDDNLVVKNYTEKNACNISFQNITLWTDLAQSMEIGYETNNGKSDNAEIYNVSFSDITVIYNFHKPVISIHNADDAVVHGVTYHNITVENANMGKGDGEGNAELIELSTSRLGSWAQTDGRGSIRDVKIENVKVLKSDRSVNTVTIEGANKNAAVENVSLNNVNVCGEQLDILASRSLKLNTNEFTENITVDSVKNTLFNRLSHWFMKIIKRLLSPIDLFAFYIKSSTAAVSIQDKDFFHTAILT